MNKVVLCGRIVADPDIKEFEKNGKEVVVANFTVACNKYGGEADFVRCCAFNRKAELLRDYFSKGDRINVFGSISTGSYTNKEGQKVYTTTVNCSEVEFVESRSDRANSGVPQAQPSPEPTPTGKDDFVSVADNVNDEGLPFNF